MSTPPTTRDCATADPSELGIVFLHHDTDPVTQRHLELVREHNPGCPVVTISQWGKVLPGGYDTRQLVGQVPWLVDVFAQLGDVGATLTEKQKILIWRNTDLAIYLWYRQRAERARRWIVVEWDVHCNTPMRDFYARVWDADLAASEVHRAHSPDAMWHWYWFNEEERGHLPEWLAPYTAGVSPLAGVLLSDAALAEISESILSSADLLPVFCELRLGSIAQYLGFVAEPISPVAPQTLSGRVEFDPAEIRSPAIWHKVKRLV